MDTKLVHLVHQINFQKRSGSQGIFPDVMHIVHLALGVDALASVIMDLTDHPTLVAGNNKSQKLDALYCNYREWCESSRRLDF